MKKKSLTAVATAFTAMSSEWMLKPGSSSNFWKMRSTCALTRDTCVSARVEIPSVSYLLPGTL